MSDQTVQHSEPTQSLSQPRRSLGHQQHQQHQQHQASPDEEFIEEDPQGLDAHDLETPGHEMDTQETFGRSQHTFGRSQQFRQQWRMLHRSYLRYVVP